MKGVAAAVAALSQEEILQLETVGAFHTEVDGQPVVIEAADVEIVSEDIPGWLVGNEGNLTVALDVEVSDELRKEGVAREIINRVQNLRKDGGLEITDRIKVYISPNVVLAEAVDAYGEYVRTQILADHIQFVANDGPEVDFHDFKVNIKVEKI